MRITVTLKTSARTAVIQDCLLFVPTNRPTSITVKCIERLTPKAVRVTLDPGPNAHLWSYTPGGYLTFCLPCGNPVLNRSYSLVQGPHDPLPQVVVKETGRSIGSAFINREFTEGMELMAYPPQSRLFPDSWNDEPNHFVMFAAGAGITPLFSVLQHVMNSDVKHEVSLFYGNSTIADILLREELETWASHPRVTIRHILSDGSLDDDMYNGRITASKVSAFCHSLSTSLPKKVLLSGPSKMKESVLRGLELVDFPTEDIRYEDFHHPPHLDAPEIPVCEVSAEYAGKSICFTYHPNEETLIEAISNRGLEAPQACRGGVCGSCRASVNEGEVVVDQDFALSHKEISEGLILCCQAKPKTEKISLSFKEDQ